MSPRAGTKSKRKQKRGKQDSAPSSVPEKKISRDDIEAKLKELQGEVDEGIESTKGIGIAVAVGGGVLLVLLAYWFGRRRGKKRQTVLEIRRI
jgi:hypothetical protein